jgi:hypothetical membrane protein
MASTRPDFAHATKAISELGSVDTPNGWIWNICGYMIPGTIVASLGWGLGSHFCNTKGARFVSYSLMASGLLMAFSGLFPGDFQNRTSFTMILHAIGSFGSFIFFLACGFSIPSLLRRFPNWEAYAWPSLALVVLSIASGFLRTGNAPGIGQRLGFACYFLWVGMMGLALLRNGTSVDRQITKP